MPLFVELIHHSDKTQPELAKELYEKLNEVEGQDKVTKAAIAASWKLLGAGKAKLETVLGPLVVWKVPEAILVGLFFFSFPFLPDLSFPFLTLLRVIESLYRHC